ncbi:MAG: hypothetical protein CMI31_13625 [Opitutae bacterium]|nr:hypothetical protein [Opitutae bacterium]|tara:strand:+ start:1665 stop:4835 length:3171 start_codon:yes stop_codon:yes gene_type:complete
MDLRWTSPGFLCFLVPGFAKLKGKFVGSEAERIDKIFIRLGTRSIPCEIIEEPGQKSFLCFLRMGWGPKLCEVFVKLKDGSEQKVGQRLLFSLRFSWESLWPKIRPPYPRRKTAYGNWLDANKWGDKREATYERQLQSLASHPLISVILPVFDPPVAFLEEAVESVLSQVYENWELRIADDGSSNPEVLSYLKDLPKRDDRIKVNFRKENGGIAIASNDAIASASGEFLAFLDHDDLLAPEALTEVALYLTTHPETDFLYSDDDKIDRNGNRRAPQFKPDWSPELLLNYCYVGHLKVVRTSLSQEVGHLREGFDGSQDYDYALRITERARHVGHIPKILYHWRISPGSTAESGDQKSGAFDAGLQAVRDACYRREINAVVKQPQWAQKGKLGIFKMDFPNEGPSVTIIIPTRNNAEKLAPCLSSIESTTYENYSVLLLDNESDSPDALELLSETSHKVLRIPNPNGDFNFSHLVNRGVEASDSDYVLLLNDDVEVLEPRWLSQMVGLLGIEGVGAVGAKLLFPNRKIQHAGIIHGMYGGLAGPAFSGVDGKESGYLSYLRVSRNYSAVTAACLLTSRKLYQELGGFDETKLAVAYNDVDFCYRLTEARNRCVYCPDAQLIHHEGASRGTGDNPTEIRAFKDRYARRKDAFYNPNFSLKSGSFEIQPRPTSGKPRTPVKALAISHNLNLEGAPLSMFEMLSGLKGRGIVEPTVLALEEGPLQSLYESKNIPVTILRFPREFVSVYEYEALLQDWSRKANIKDYDAVYANTLETFFAMDAAHLNEISSIWNIRESLSPNRLFTHLMASIRKRAYECFQWPHRVIFVAQSTMNSYAPLESRDNFTVIPNALNLNRFPSSEEDGRSLSREKLNISVTDKVILCVGTLCRRKAQMDLVKAFEKLPIELLNSTTLLLAGESVGKYGQLIERKIEQIPSLKERTRLLAPNENPHHFYQAADLYVCCSESESYPRTVLEAMLFGLPILATPTYGVREQVREGYNARFFEFGNLEKLGDNLCNMLENNDLLVEMGANSRKMLRSLDTIDEMLDGYEDHFLSAAIR